MTVHKGVMITIDSFLAGDTTNLCFNTFYFYSKVSPVLKVKREILGKLFLRINTKYLNMIDTAILFITKLILSPILLVTN